MAPSRSRVRSSVVAACLAFAGLATACAPGAPGGSVLTGSSQPSFGVSVAQPLACTSQAGSFTVLVTDVVDNDKVSYSVASIADAGAPPVDSGVAAEDVPTTGVVLPAGCYVISLTSIGTAGGFAYRISW